MPVGGGQHCKEHQLQQPKVCQLCDLATRCDRVWRQRAFSVQPVLHVNALCHDHTHQHLYYVDYHALASLPPPPPLRPTVPHPHCAPEECLSTPVKQRDVDVTAIVDLTSSPTSSTATTVSVASPVRDSAPHQNPSDDIIIIV